jgi:hypothetical protein
MLQTLPADFVDAECGSRIRWLRTLALIQQTWLSPSSSSSSSTAAALFLDQLCEEDLESEEQRRVLFDRLLEISREDVQRLSALSKVLHFWPPFLSSERYECSTLETHMLCCCLILPPLPLSPPLCTSRISYPVSLPSCPLSLSLPAMRTPLLSNR